MRIPPAFVYAIVSSVLFRLAREDLGSSFWEECAPRAAKLEQAARGHLTLLAGFLGHYGSQAAPTSRNGTLSYWLWMKADDPTR